MHNKHQVHVYYFPNYHADPRNEELHGKGWTEWEIVKAAHPRFPGHRQPLVPQWGYQDESDPEVMACKIAAAAEHGISGFIFDWYWYEGQPALQRALENGFMKANNNCSLNFSLMWANHDCDFEWLKYYSEVRKKTVRDSILPGYVDQEAFDKMTDYIVGKYFIHPSCLKIGGCPYFSIYSLKNLLKGFDGIEGTREALERFRIKAKKAGFPGLHINAIVSWVNVLGFEMIDGSMYEVVERLGFDSATTYCWNPYIKSVEEGRKFPATEYMQFEEAIKKHWEYTRNGLKIPFYPNATMGWDPSPRTAPSDKYENLGYPFMEVCVNNTPGGFKKYLVNMREFMDKHGIEFCTINAWNEWTEGSYLEPDTVYGMSYLGAVKDVFGNHMSRGQVR